MRSLCNRDVIIYFLHISLKLVNLRNAGRTIIYKKWDLHIWNHWRWPLIPLGGCRPQKSGFLIPKIQLGFENYESWDCEIKQSDHTIIKAAYKSINDFAIRSLCLLARFQETSIKKHSPMSGRNVDWLSEIEQYAWISFRVLHLFYC
jgi:hypothetical protein